MANEGIAAPDDLPGKPNIPAPTWGRTQRLIVGTLCAVISIGVLYGIILLLEYFKEMAPRQQEMMQRGRELKATKSRTEPRRRAP